MGTVKDRIAVNELTASPHRAPVECPSRIRP